MSTTAIVTISVVGALFFFCIVGIIIGVPGLVQDYPKEWEEELPLFSPSWPEAFPSERTGPLRGLWKKI